MQNPRERDAKRRGSASWIGLLIFLLLVLGPQIINAVSRVVSQITGGGVTVGPNIIPVIIGGLILLSVLVAVVRSVAGVGGRGDTRLPTSDSVRTSSMRTELPKAPPSPYRSSASQSSTLRKVQQGARIESDYTSQHLPGAPQFEPIISGKVLALGILGLMVVALIFGAAFVLSTMPITP